MILTGRQIRKGREFVGLSQADLAAAAYMALAHVVRIEAVDSMAMMRKSDAVVIRSVFETSGVEFSLENGKDIGVLLRKSVDGSAIGVSR